MNVITKQGGSEVHEEVGLGPGGNVPGRERGATMRIGHPSVAREHARILVTGDQAVIENLAGAGNTFRGSEAVDGDVVLLDGDVVRSGDVELVYRTRRIPRGA